MRLKKHLLLSSSLLISASAFAQTNRLPIIHLHRMLSSAPKLNPTALEYAVKGYDWAYQHHEIGPNNQTLTVIDFNSPAYEKRLWVFDIKSGRLLMNAYTTQGKGSGLVKATRFSNQARTDETSLGIYKTLNTYSGEHGLSMRLQGLENGINNNAYRRDIVVHPAWYSTPAFVKKYHRTGRSWGCFGINPAVSTQFIKLTRGGSIIYAYASPEKNDPYLV